MTTAVVHVTPELPAGEFEPMHDTDGGYCWCQPTVEGYVEGRVVIHRRSLDSPRYEDADPVLFSTFAEDKE